MDTPSTSNAVVRKKPTPPPLELGWREWAALPALGVARIKAKIDTGAKTSAIHAYRIDEIERDGRAYASFFLHPVQRRRAPEIGCVAPIADRRRIRSSNGMLQERLIIRTTLVMGPRAWSVDLSLTNRDEMGFRMLIGRDALKKNIVIRPGKSYLLGGDDDRPVAADPSAPLSTPGA